MRAQSAVAAYRRKKESTQNSALGMDWKEYWPKAPWGGKTSPGFTTKGVRGRGRGKGQGSWRQVTALAGVSTCEGQVGNGREGKEQGREGKEQGREGGREGGREREGEGEGEGEGEEGVGHQQPALGARTESRHEGPADTDHNTQKHAVAHVRKHGRTGHTDPGIACLHTHATHSGHTDAHTYAIGTQSGTPACVPSTRFHQARAHSGTRSHTHEHKARHTLSQKLRHCNSRRTRTTCAPGR
jgi:hypothetical protein